MQKHNAKFIWRDGYEENFEVIATKFWVNSIINHYKNLNFVRGCSIIDENGKVLYDDIKTKDAYTKPTKEDSNKANVQKR
jgi:hypothetical protein